MKFFYRSIFSLNFYKEINKKPLWKVIVYFIVVTIGSGFLSGMVRNYSIKDNLEIELVKMYNDIPEFTLSSKGLKIEENKVFEFKFADLNIYVDASKNLSDLIVEDVIDKSNSGLFIGKDGYGKVRGTVLESGGYFKDTKVLEGVELTKKDFNIFQDILKIHGRTILAVSLIGIMLIFFINSLIASVCIALFNYIFAIIYSSRVTIKESFIVSLYLTTIYTVGNLIISCMSVNKNSVVYGMLLISLIIVYIYLITKQRVFKRSENVE